MKERISRVILYLFIYDVKRLWDGGSQMNQAMQPLQGAPENERLKDGSKNASIQES